jgi:hypothetical protein
MGKRGPRDKQEIPKEVREVIEEAKRAVARDHIDPLARYESFAAEHLVENNLPTEQGTYQLVDDEGIESQPMGLVSLIKALGYDDWGKEYYSAYTLTYVAAIRQLQALGQTDAAIEAALELGALLAEEEFHEASVEGQRAWEAQRKAVHAAWGSLSERLAKKDGLRKLYEEAIKDGAKTDADAYEIAAKKAKTSAKSWRDARVTARTVRRAVTGN